MNGDNVEERLASVPAAERILLLPHCLRRADSCQGKYGKWGLECRECNPDCSVNRLRRAALDLGYKGVCVAPGGRLAVNYVKETRPRAIVAVACGTELEEGVHGVRGLGDNEEPPVIAVIPLARDGCVDTQVDEERALEVIGLECSREPVRDGSR